MSGAGADLAIGAIFGDASPPAQPPSPQADSGKSAADKLYASSATPKASDAAFSTESFSTESFSLTAFTFEQAEAEVPTEQVLYGNPEVLVKSYEPTIGRAIDRFMESTESTPEDRSAMLRDSAVIFNEIGMPSDQVVGFMDDYVGAMTDRPITDEDIETWNTQVKAELTAQYGVAGFDSRLAKARTYVKSVPGLGEALEISGLGSHPKVVAALMERANNLRPRKSK